MARLLNTTVSIYQVVKLKRYQILAALLFFLSAVASVMVLAASYILNTKDSITAASIPVNTLTERNVEQTQARRAADLSASDPSNNTAWASLQPAYQYYKVHVAQDGSLQSGEQTLHLYGVSVPPRSHICSYRNGERWPCGQRAYIALINFIGSTTIACTPKHALQPNVVICRLASIDISAWMLQNGWATLTSGVTEQIYIEASAAGIAHKVGIWAERPEKNIGTIINQGQPRSR